MNQDSSLKKQPKTKRGIATQNKLLAAAEKEFGEKGYHEAAISGITQTAGVALGTFYVYFDSKEEIFRALVEHMGHLTRDWISSRIESADNRLEAEKLGIKAFLDFVREHKNLYQIISEAQFVAEDAYRNYYESFAQAYERNLVMAGEKSEITPGDYATWVWGLIGMNVFLGMRFGAWDASRPSEEIADAIGEMLSRGIAKQ